MENVNILIKTGDREYPLLVPASNEPRLRQAEKLINEKLDEYRKIYPAADRTDHAAMTAIFLANAYLSVDNAAETDVNELQKQLQQVELELDQALTST